MPGLVLNNDAMERALDYLKNKAPGRAETRAARIFQEKYLKALLAQKMMKSTANSMAAKECEAEASLEYAQALLDYRNLINQDELNREHANAAQLIIEIWRTEQFNRRSGL